VVVVVFHCFQLSEIRDLVCAVKLLSSIGFKVRRGRVSRESRPCASSFNLP